MDVLSRVFGVTVSDCRQLRPAAKHGHTKVNASSPREQEAEAMEVCDVQPATKSASTTECSPRPWAVLEVDDTMPQSHIDQFLDFHRPSQCTTALFPWISVARSG